MEDSAYNTAMAGILASDNRYDYQAYSFMNEALAYTVNKQGASRGPSVSRHVSGDVLVRGILEFAVRRFSFLAGEVFEYWNIRTGTDAGNIVYNMIAAGIMSASSDDRREDFDGMEDIPTMLRNLSREALNPPLDSASPASLPKIN